MATAPSSVVNKHPAVSTKTVDTIQFYAGLMENIMKSNFSKLYSAPDSVYIMMATMGLESGFRIYHENGTTPNHKTIKITAGIGRSYWTDPVIVPIRDAQSTNVTEGLSAKALMATMGMYQVRNCRESNSIITGAYRDIAEGNGLMVNPGDSISATFPNDDTGAQRSMIMGCIIMEFKYLSRLKKYTKDTAIYLAVGDYLGKAGAKDVLGTSPEMRIQNVSSPNSNIARTLAAAGIKKGGTTAYTTVPQDIHAFTETKTETTASSNNPPINTSGCTRA
jgi:hypothetical protein